MKIIKKLLFSVILAAFIFFPCIGLSTETTAQAGTQTFTVPNETKPTPILFRNGSFQTPTVTYVRPEDGARYQAFTIAQMNGWQTVPIDYASYGNTPAAYLIELQVVDPTGHSGLSGHTFATSEADGNQYAELNCIYPGRLYQVLSTTPGSRIYWQYAHRAIGNNASRYDQMNFYLRPAGTPTVAPSASQLVQTSRDNGTAWYYYRGVYNVPAGQSSTEFAFASVSSWTNNLQNGNFLDDIALQTGSKLIAKKSINTSAANDSYAFKGEIVTVTVAVTNWGEADASRCVFHDILSDGLEYIPGSVLVNGDDPPASRVTYNSSTDELKVLIGESVGAEGGLLYGSKRMGNASGEGEMTEITYQARVTGNAGYVVKNQASVTYNDRNYENYNASGFTSYSSVLGQTPVGGNELTYVNRFMILDRTIDGRVWYDTNVDGMINTGDTMASGLTVGVYQNSDTTYTTPVNDTYGHPLVATTDVSGNYRFSAIPGGTYKIVVTTPSGYIVTVKTASSHNKAVPSGTRAIISGLDLTNAAGLSDQDFGFAVNRTINGRAWIDMDSDGMIDTAETRVSGLTVGLYQNSDTTYTTPVNNIFGTPLTTTTNTSGEYSFSAIPAGTYKAVVTTPTGYFVTVRTVSTDNDAVSSGTRGIAGGINLSTATSATNFDFGFEPNRTMNGRVWYDTDADGMIDGTETRVSELTVGLYLSSDTTYTTPVNDKLGNPLVTTTNASGVYSFSYIPYGTYKVVITTPTGYIVTVKTVSTDNDAVAEGTRAIAGGVNLTAAASATNLDFGFAANRVAGGRVWYDADADGMIDTGETRASGLTVGLYQNSDTAYTTPVNDIYGNPLTATANSSGEYSFSAVPAGTYKAVMITPGNYSVTVKTVSTDNDAVAEGIRAIVNGIDLTTAISITNADFGFILNTRSLTLSKLVKGRLADPQENFTFTVALTGVTGPLPYTGASTVTGVSAPADGSIESGGTITLRHGQTVIIGNVPLGTAYSITETGGTGYTQTVTGGNASGTVTDDVAVEFINTKNDITPTGVLLDILPYAVMLALAVGILAVFLVIRRNRRPPGRKPGPLGGGNSSGRGEYRGL